LSFEPNLNNRSNALIDSRAGPDAKQFRGYCVVIADVLKGDDSPITIPDEYLCILISRGTNSMYGIPTSSPDLARTGVGDFVHFIPDEVSGRRGTPLGGAVNAVA